MFCLTINNNYLWDKDIAEELAYGRRRVSTKAGGHAKPVVLKGAHRTLPFDSIHIHFHCGGEEEESASDLIGNIESDHYTLTDCSILIVKSWSWYTLFSELKIKISSNKKLTETIAAKVMTAAPRGSPREVMRGMKAAGLVIPCLSEASSTSFSWSWGDKLGEVLLNPRIFTRG